MPTFNLLEEKWIPVVRMDGKPDLLNLREILQEADQLREIRDPLPTVEFGLYRLLVALTIDIFGPTGPNELSDILEAGRFDNTRIEEYFSRWEDRFDLFHSTYPFLQSAEMKSGEPKPLAGLLHPLPSGTNVAHFHHPHEDEFGVTPAAAARLLTTLAPFMTAGGAGLAPSINGAPPWYILLSRPGDTLFGTVCLNCCVVPLGQVRGKEPPAWRSEQPISDERSKGASLLEALTWRPRRIQFIPGEGGRCSLTGAASPVLIRTMKFSAGSSCDFAWRDPSVPYRITSDKGPTAMRPQEGKDAWRDTGPLALLRENTFSSRDGKISFERPALVTQFAQLLQDGALPRRTALSLTAYCLRTDMKMKIFEWRREKLALPGELVLQSRFHLQAQRSMEDAESVAQSIRRAIKHAYPREGKGNKSAFDTIIAEAQGSFWTLLRSDYDTLLTNLAPLRAEGDEAKLEECQAGWKKSLRHHGARTLEEAIDNLDADAEALRRQVEARRVFWNSFHKVFNPATPKGGAGQKPRPATSQSATLTKGAI